MKKSIIITGSLMLILTLSLAYCSKKLFHKVGVHGRLVHFYTKQPVPFTRVTLSSDDLHTKGNAHITLESAVSDGNGFFTIKTRASRSHYYYLNTENSGDLPVDLNEGHTTDIGDFLTGSQAFIYKLRLLAVNPGRCLTIFNNNTRLEISSDTTITGTTLKRHEVLESMSFPIFYFTHYCASPDSVRKDMEAGIPITNADTLNYTIRF